MRRSAIRGPQRTSATSSTEALMALDQHLEVRHGVTVGDHAEEHVAVRYPGGSTPSSRSITSSHCRADLKWRSAASRSAKVSASSTGLRRGTVRASRDPRVEGGAVLERLVAGERVMAGEIGCQVAAGDLARWPPERVGGDLEGVAGPTRDLGAQVGRGDAGEEHASERGPDGDRRDGGAHAVPRWPRRLHRPAGWRCLPA